VRLVSPIGGAPDVGGNLSTSFSNVERLAAHPRFVCFFVEKSFINWRFFPLVKINSRISDTLTTTWIFKLGLPT
jgi:hypothetical protein